MADPIRPASGTAAARYTRVAQALHWAIAACIFLEIGLGFHMSDPRGPQTFAVFQLHKSVGVTILLLTLVRIGWRLGHRPPAFPPTMHGWERGLAHAVHAGFYVALLALPLTGWLAVSASPLGIPTLLYGTIPWPHLPVSPSRALSDAAGGTHETLVWLALALIALHVAGALKHQFVDRGRDMARMLPVSATASARRLGVATVGVVLAAVLLAALGRTVQLRPIAQPGAPTPAAATAVAEAEPVLPAPPVATPAPAAPAAAEEPAPAVPAADAAPAAPARWRVAAARSSLAFSTAWSQGPVEGRFARWTADILFAPDALDRSRVTVSVDLASVTTDSGDTQSALPGDEWFAVARHPRAVFTATRFRSLGGDRYEAAGTLSLRGVEHPFTLPFTLRIAGDAATMTATASLDRTLFGVGQGEWAKTDDVPAAVKLAIRVAATRSPQ